MAPHPSWRKNTLTSVEEIELPPFPCLKEIPIGPFIQYHWQPVFQDTNTWKRLFRSHHPLYGVGQKFGNAHMIHKLLVWKHLNFVLLIKVNKWIFLWVPRLCATSFNGLRIIWWFMKIRALYLNPVDNRVCCRFRRSLVDKSVRKLL